MLVGRRRLVQEGVGRQVVVVVFSKAACAADILRVLSPDRSPRTSPRTARHAGLKPVTEMRWWLMCANLEQ
jgi:hypothetical protein